MAVGFIYILENPAFRENILKIGKTTRTPAQRSRQLSTTGVPAQFQVVFDIESCDCDYAEALIHSWLAEKRYSKDREFFHLPVADAIDLVKKAVVAVENTPPENRVFGPLRRKIENIPRPKEIRSFPPEVQSSIGAVEGHTAYIKRATRTVFRQNNFELDGGEVYVTLIGRSWRDDRASKEAIVYFSRASGNLVVIPKKTVDTFLFDPYFRKTPTGYDLLDDYRPFLYEERRMNLKFVVEQDRLLVLFKAPTQSQRDPLPLLSLSSVYWPKIDLDERDPVSSLVEKIKRLCQALARGEGITAM